MKVYVEAKSKAALIRRLAAGEEISGYNYSMFGGGGHYMLDDTLEDGTIIAIYNCSLCNCIKHSYYILSTY